jgi:hypothetical protein
MENTQFLSIKRNLLPVRYPASQCFALMQYPSFVICPAAMSFGGSSGGTLLNALLPAQMWGIHQGTASECDGNNALSSKAIFFMWGYSKYVLPLLDLSKLDETRRTLLRAFCASLSKQERARLGVEAEVKAFEVRGAIAGVCLSGRRLCDL